MKGEAALYSSATEEWRTPRALFDALDAEFGFTLDAAATSANALCPRYFTAQNDALSQEWNGTVWLNPPYGKDIGRWVAKAYEEAKRHPSNVVVCLLPARTDTGWFHDYVMQADEVRFIRGRVRFSNTNVGAPFPNMIVVFDWYQRVPTFSSMDRHRDPRMEQR